MNKERRKAIATALAAIDTAAQELAQARDEEQEYYDAMPEGPQGGERGEAASTAIDALTDLIDNLDCDPIREACGI